MWDSEILNSRLCGSKIRQFCYCAIPRLPESSVPDACWRDMHTEGWGLTLTLDVKLCVCVKIKGVTLWISPYAPHFQSRKQPIHGTHIAKHTHQKLRNLWIRTCHETCRVLSLDILSLVLNHQSFKSGNFWRGEVCVAFDLTNKDLSLVYGSVRSVHWSKLPLRRVEHMLSYLRVSRWLPDS